MFNVVYRVCQDEAIYKASLYIQMQLFILEGFFRTCFLHIEVHSIPRQLRLFLYILTCIWLLIWRNDTQFLDKKGNLKSDSLDLLFEANYNNSLYSLQLFAFSTCTHSWWPKNFFSFFFFLFITIQTNEKDDGMMSNNIN